MPKFLIERNIPDVGSMSPEQIRAAAQKSNDALATLAPRVQWQHSYLSDDVLCCVFIADDEAAVVEHAQLTGLPADNVYRVLDVLDPTTGEGG
jgi:hypothetical protein